MPPEPAWTEQPDTLETPERVNISIDLASVGSRGLACILDTLLVLALLLVVALIAALSTLVLKQWALVFGLGAFFLIHWFYFAIFEGVWNGQTPGKRLVGLRVQKVGGYPVGWSACIIRNFLRFIDSFLGYAVGILVMLLTSRHQRLGDLVAGTVVVRERPHGAGEIAAMGYDRIVEAPSSFVGGGALTGAEFEMLHDLLSRKERIEPGSYGRLVAAMAGVMRRRLESRGALSEDLRVRRDTDLLEQLDAAFAGPEVRSGAGGSMVP